MEFIDEEFIDNIYSDFLFFQVEISINTTFNEIPIESLIDRVSYSCIEYIIYPSFDIE